MDGQTQIAWFVARNSDGEYYVGERPWHKELRYARRYETIGPVKSAVTKWVKRNPGKPVPEILEWVVDISSARIVDVAGETTKRIHRAEVKAAREARERADDELARIRAKQEILKAREQELLNR